MGTGGISLGVKRDHSPQSSAEVLRIVELYLHPIRLHGVVLN
jgi:hypothetical protein